MLTNCRLAILLSFICLSGTLHAQWLTPADECASYRLQSSSASLRPTSPAEPVDAGIDEAFKWYWHQRTFGLGYIPQGALQKAVQQREAMRLTPGKGMSVQSATPAWTLIGPANIGGRVNAIVINPYNQNTVYIGAANGGVWKTSDAGANWTPLTDQYQSVSMGSLAIDPNDTNIIFAGTGELPPVIDAYAGYGILRSSDGGSTWADVGPTSVGAYTRVIVNPKHSNLVYAAAGKTGGGVLRSSDGGITWNWLAGGLPQNLSVSDLALSMNGDVAVLYAGVVSSGVYQSTDGGDSWTLMSNLSFAMDGTNSFSRIALDVDPTNWQNIVVLDVNSVNSGAQDDLGGIEVSNDGGNTWSEIDQEWQGTALFSNGATSQGTYDVYVRVDPTNFNHMLVGGISVWQTNDGGQTWSDVGLSYKGGIHPDQHDAAFAPSNPSKAVYVGCDGGVFFSGDGGSTFSANTFPIPITQFYGIGIDQTQSDVTYGGTQDNYTLSGASGSTNNWVPILGGDGSYTLVDPKTPSIVYCMSQDNTYPSISTNGGAGVASTCGIETSDSTAWLDPFAADVNNDIIYWGCQKLLYSTNQGKCWTTCSQVFGSVAAYSTISALDAFGDGKTVLAGTDGGYVYLTTNNGKSFTNVSGDLPARAVTWVKFNPSSQSTFYATLSGFGAGHVFKTTNSGSHWMDIEYSTAGYSC